MNLTIIKYDNRKLYSRDVGRYITLSEIYEAFKEGFNVKVVNYKSQEDISKDTILKAISTHGDLNLNDLRKLLN